LDTLNGGSGTDTLEGGKHSDTYLYNRGNAHDLIVESDHGSDQDMLLFGQGISKDQLWFEQMGNDLNIRVIGTDDAVSIKDWYAGVDHKVERIETSNGALLVDNQVQQLVSAMAAFAPPGSGEWTLPQTLRDELEPVIANAWQG
jgi:Ca2+-binding RTX toxin-like protein